MASLIFSTFTSLKPFIFPSVLRVAPWTDYADLRRISTKARRRESGVLTAMVWNPTAFNFVMSAAPIPVRLLHQECSEILKERQGSTQGLDIVDIKYVVVLHRHISNCADRRLTFDTSSFRSFPPMVDSGMLQSWQTVLDSDIGMIDKMSDEMKTMSSM